MTRFSSVLIAALAAAGNSLAGPPDVHGHDNATLFARKDDLFGGNINFSSRSDCTSPCVENGFCIDGKESEGDLALDNHYGTWYSASGKPTCWEVPDGSHSVALSVTTDRGYSGSSGSCEKLKKAHRPEDWNGTKHFDLLSGLGTASDSICTKATALPEEMDSIFYNWPEE